MNYVNYEFSSESGLSNKDKIKVTATLIDETGKYIFKDKKTKETSTITVDGLVEIPDKLSDKDKKIIQKKFGKQFKECLSPDKEIWCNHFTMYLGMKDIYYPKTDATSKYIADEVNFIGLKNPEFTFLAI